MSEEVPPSLFKILRDDFTAMRSEVNQRFDGLASQMVTQSFIAQVQANQKERDDRQDARLRELEQDLEQEKRDRLTAQEEARKVKAQQWFAIGSGLLLALVGVIGGVVTWTVTQGLQGILEQLGSP